MLLQLVVDDAEIKRAISVVVKTRSSSHATHTSVSSNEHHLEGFVLGAPFLPTQRAY